MLILLTSSFPLPDPDAFVHNLLILETRHPFLRGRWRPGPPGWSLLPSLVLLCWLPAQSPGSHTAHTKRFPSEISAEFLGFNRLRGKAVHICIQAHSPPGFPLTPPPYPQKMPQVHLPPKSYSLCTS